MPVFVCGISSGHRRVFFLSMFRGLWSGSDIGLDTSKKRSKHQSSKALAFNPVPALDNNNSSCVVTIISVYYLKCERILLCLAESVPNFVCM